MLTFISKPPRGKVGTRDNVVKNRRYFDNIFFYFDEFYLLAYAKIRGTM